MVEDEGAHWLKDDKFEGMSDDEIYLTSFYFIITTFSTVGYGDISATNSFEKVFCIVIMVLGVTAFAAGTSELTNLLSNYDQENAVLQEKLHILNRIFKEYSLPLELYESAKQSLNYIFKNDLEELIKFVQDLPNDLQTEIMFFIFERTFNQLHFFKDKPLAFIVWVCPLLKPLFKSKNQYVFFEDDDISCIYFFKQGSAGFVLPKYQNFVYQQLEKGLHFGVSCIVASFINKGQIEFDIDEWITQRDQLRRSFTIQCLDESEFLTLSLQDLNHLKNEFYEIYIQIF